MSWYEGVEEARTDTEEHRGDDEERPAGPKYESVNLWVCGGKEGCDELVTKLADKLAGGNHGHDDSEHEGEEVDAGGGGAAVPDGLVENGDVV